jgi:hypothetical protein
MKLKARQKKVFLKCVEELNELSTALMQELNKKKCKYNEICLEVKDVEARLTDLKDVLRPDKNYPNYNPNLLKLGSAESFPF